MHLKLFSKEYMSVFGISVHAYPPHQGIFLAYVLMPLSLVISHKQA